jgi:hypothetical protein
LCNFGCPARPTCPTCGGTQGPWPAYPHPQTPCAPSVARHASPDPRGAVISAQALEFYQVHPRHFRKSPRIKVAGAPCQVRIASRCQHRIGRTQLTLHQLVEGGHPADAPPTLGRGRTQPTLHQLMGGVAPSRRTTNSWMGSHRADAIQGAPLPALMTHRATAPNKSNDSRGAKSTEC